MLADFMVQAMHLKEPDARRLRAVFRASGIHTRHSVLDDYGLREGFTFYPSNGHFRSLPSTKSRMEEYRRHAPHLSLRAVEDCLAARPGFQPGEVTHLITVSCTGMYAPGLDIDLVKALKLNPTVSRTQINFMGCYAALTALRLAHTIAAASPATVLIVCCELCSLHFQNEPTEDNLYANALFADGAAAALVQSAASSGLSLESVLFHSDVAPEGDQDMAWTIGDTGFDMKLSSYVPEILKGSLRPFTEALLKRVPGRDRIAHYAVHPGGKKILQSVEEQLGISASVNEHAYAVLRDFGNMSSPTVLFVLQRIFKGLSPADTGTSLLSFAFGPGLTLESALFNVHSRP
jgi:predicted naringenin-chalcone synthase